MYVSAECRVPPKPQLPAAQVFGLLDMQEQVEAALANMALTLESSSASNILADFTQLAAMIRQEVISRPQYTCTALRRVWQQTNWHLLGLQKHILIHQAALMLKLGDYALINFLCPELMQV